jgi:capsular polysaccharide biosynthesis protein
VGANQKKSARNSQWDDETFLIEALHFFRVSYKIIFTFGALGVALAILSILLTSNRYEATSEIVVAQIANPNSALSPVGVAVEGPELLVSRLSSPTTFTNDVIVSCGFQGDPDPLNSVKKSIKLNVTGATNIVRVINYGRSPQEARDCSMAIFSLIKDTQNQISAPYIEEAKKLLNEKKVRLKKLEDFISTSDGLNLPIGGAYLMTRDEVNDLRDKIDLLNFVVTTSSHREARLVSPIYASDIPLAPKKRVVLAAGLLSGLLLGIIIAMGYRVLAKPNE